MEELEGGLGSAGQESDAAALPMVEGAEYPAVAV